MKHFEISRLVFFTAIQLHDCFRKTQIIFCIALHGMIQIICVETVLFKVLHSGTRLFVIKIFSLDFVPSKLSSNAIFSAMQGPARSKES